MKAYSQDLRDRAIASFNSGYKLDIHYKTRWLWRNWSIAYLMCPLAPSLPLSTFREALFWMKILYKKRDSHLI
jgi:hypothetical protein